MRKPFEIQGVVVPSWQELLAEPGDGEHIVQIYHDDCFLGEAVSHFAAEGLARGEAVILVPTASHWRSIEKRLDSKGVDSRAFRQNGQLTVLDAGDTMPLLMDGAMPDEKAFRFLAREAIEKARGDRPRVRWWGEIVNTLYLEGNLRASTRMEELCTEVARDTGTAIFCSFLMDKFSPRTYDEAFGAICRTHGQLIPARDYAAHRLAINSAIAEVIGNLDGALLRSLMAWQGTPASMPSSQSLLLWVKEALPEQFDRVLDAARGHEKMFGHSHVCSHEAGAS